MNTPVKISGPVEVIRAVPYLIGFHPSESLVILGLHEGRIVITSRLDLSDVAEALSGLLEALKRNAVGSVVIVAFTDRGLEHDDQAYRAATAAAAAELAVDDAIITSGGRWRSLLCTNPQCCPPHGQPLGEQTPVAVADLILKGEAPQDSRAALAATLDPDPDLLVPVDFLDCFVTEFAEARATGTWPSWLNSAKRGMFAAARDPQRTPTAIQIARYGIALGELETRNAVWFAVDDGRLPDPELWRILATSLPNSYRAAPLFLFGWANYRKGNGGLAGIAAERAIAADPHYTAADLLIATLQQGIAPRELPKLATARRVKH